MELRGPPVFPGGCGARPPRSRPVLPRWRSSPAGSARRTPSPKDSPLPSDGSRRRGGATRGRAEAGRVSRSYSRSLRSAAVRLPSRPARSPHIQGRFASGWPRKPWLQKHSQDFATSHTSDSPLPLQQERPSELLHPGEYLLEFLGCRGNLPFRARKPKTLRLADEVLEVPAGELSLARMNASAPLF